MQYKNMQNENVCYSTQCCTFGVNVRNITDEKILRFIVNHIDSIRSDKYSAEQKEKLRCYVPDTGMIHDMFRISEHIKPPNNKNTKAIEEAIEAIIAVNDILQDIADHTLDEHKCLEVVAAILTAETDIDIEYFKTPTSDPYLITLIGIPRTIENKAERINAFRTIFDPYFRELGIDHPIYAFTRFGS